MNNNKNINNKVLLTICELLKVNNLQQKDLCEALNLTNKSFTEWKAGRSVSYMKRLPEIADYFGVSVNYLLGKETQKENAPGETVLTESENMLLELFRSLPPDKQELVAQTVKAFADSQK
jgi:transcriptional regulator with XRE-family HTH domain